MIGLHWRSAEISDVHDINAYSLEANTALKLSIADIQQYTVVLEGMEQVSKTVTYYHVVERLYLLEQKETTNKLKEAILDLYTKVLRFLIEAKLFYMKSTASE